MAAATSSDLNSFLVGRPCQVVKRESDWTFNFGEGLNIGASVPWRIVTAEGIGFGDIDDGQWFGLPQPVDGEATVNALLKGHIVTDVEVDELTADLHIHFGNGVRLDLFNPSSGYEAWAAKLSRAAAPSISIIAMGGGGLTIFSD